jgi:hypothetical protein
MKGSADGVPAVAPAAALLRWGACRVRCAGGGGPGPVGGLGLGGRPGGPLGGRRRAWVRVGCGGRRAAAAAGAAAVRVPHRRPPQVRRGDVRLLHSCAAEGTCACCCTGARQRGTCACCSLVRGRGTCACCCTGARQRGRAPAAALVRGRGDVRLLLHWCAAEGTCSTQRRTIVWRMSQARRMRHAPHGMS